MTIMSMSDCLIIGSPEGLISNGPADVRNCQTVNQALDLLKTEPFAKIFVVFSDLDEPKTDTLKKFHEISSNAKFTLLAQMHEEPAAIDILDKGDFKGVDYLICPINSRVLTDEDHAATPQREDEKDRKIRELETLVLQDDLTGLNNRRYLRHFLPAIIQQAASRDFQVTLLLFDIDDFKRYNDSFGHSVGDRVLRQTASLIRRCCRTQDVVVRLGGDEFAVVFWDSGCLNRTMPESEAERDRRVCRNHPREALFMAERFRREMSTASFDVLGVKGKGSLTISGGLATFPTDATTAESLFEKADQAMFEAKRSGKNRLYLVGGAATQSAD